MRPPRPAVTGRAASSEVLPLGHEQRASPRVRAPRCRRRSGGAERASSFRGRAGARRSDAQGEAGRSTVWWSGAWSWCSTWWVKSPASRRCAGPEQRRTRASLAITSGGASACPAPSRPSRASAAGPRCFPNACRHPSVPTPVFATGKRSSSPETHPGTEPCDPSTRTRTSHEAGQPAVGVHAGAILQSAMRRFPTLSTSSSPKPSAR